MSYLKLGEWAVMEITVWRSLGASYPAIITFQFYFTRK